MNETEKLLRKSIGKKIKIARAKTHYTQEILAEKLSLTSKYVSQLERGLAFGSATTIINLCKTLNINSDFLFDDLINANDSCFDDFIDDKFLESYIQLNEYNKNVVMALTSQLIKLQDTCDNDKNKTKTKDKK